VVRELVLYCDGSLEGLAGKLLRQSFSAVTVSGVDEFLPYIFLKNQLKASNALLNSDKYK
jgi:hypothetical protein